MKLKTFLLFTVLCSCKTLPVLIGSSLVVKDGLQCLMLNNVVETTEASLQYSVDPELNNIIIDQFNAIKGLLETNPNLTVFFEDLPLFFKFGSVKNLLQLLTEHSSRSKSRQLVQCDKRSSMQYARILELLIISCTKDVDSELVENLSLLAKNSGIKTLNDLRAKIMSELFITKLSIRDRAGLEFMFDNFRFRELFGLDFLDFIQIVKNTVPECPTFVFGFLTLLRKFFLSRIIPLESNNTELDEMDRFIVNEFKKCKSDSVVLACSHHISKIKNYLLSQGFSTLRETGVHFSWDHEERARLMGQARPIPVSEIDFLGR